MLLNAATGIAEYLAANWTRTPVVWENDNFSPDGSAFIRASLSPIGSVQAELSEAGKNRFDAILAIDVFTPLGSGIGDGLDLADSVLSLFDRNTTISKNGTVLHFGVPSILPGRPDGFGFYQYTVECPWFTFY